MMMPGTFVRVVCLLFLLELCTFTVPERIFPVSVELMESFKTQPQPQMISAIHSMSGVLLYVGNCIRTHQT